MPSFESSAQALFQRLQATLGVIAHRINVVVDTVRSDIVLRTSADVIRILGGTSALQEIAVKAWTEIGGSNDASVSIEFSDFSPTLEALCQAVEDTLKSHQLSFHLVDIEPAADEADNFVLILTGLEEKVSEIVFDELKSLCALFGIPSIKVLQRLVGPPRPASLTVLNAINRIQPASVSQVETFLQATGFDVDLTFVKSRFDLLRRNGLIRVNKTVDSNDETHWVASVTREGHNVLPIRRTRTSPDIQRALHLGRILSYDRDRWGTQE